MKTSFYAAYYGLLAAAAVGNMLATAQASAMTAQERVTMFNMEDFVFTLGGPEPDTLVDGQQLRLATVSQIPALEGYGVSMGIVNLDPCTINLPHIHPRATEMLYVIKGDLRVAFLEENGGEGVVVNDVSQGDVAFFPQGLIHYQQNLGCEPASFIAALNSDDPGAVLIATQFFALPIEAIQATINIEVPALQPFIDGLPEAPGLARRRCLQACGLLDDDEDLSYNFD
ncbi:unnamed protein product [Pylaiella littoralis]